MDGDVIWIDNNMERNLIINEPRIVINSIRNDLHQVLTLKIGIGRRIYNFPGFFWSQEYRRWQRKEEIKLRYDNEDKIEFEFYHRSSEDSNPIVFAQGILRMEELQKNESQEIKVPFSYNSSNVGWLYFEPHFSDQRQLRQLQTFTLYKFNLCMKSQFLEVKVTAYVKHNTYMLRKKILLQQKNTSNECEIILKQKQPVKMSDCLIIHISTPNGDCLPINILMDDITRGKQHHIEKKLFSDQKIRMGALRISYYLENAFLINEKVNHLMSLVLPIKRILEEEVYDATLEKKRIYDKIDEADLKVVMINQSISKLTSEIAKKDIIKHRGFKSINPSLCRDSLLDNSVRSLKKAPFKSKEKLDKENTNEPENRTFQSEVTKESQIKKLQFYFGK